jgi:Tol biopolymer transport system component
MAGISISSDNTILFSYMFDPGIFSFNESGLNLHHISKGMTPSWSPDKSKMVFQAFAPLVIGDKFGDKLVFLDKKFGKDPCWSTDGYRIAYTYQPDLSIGPQIKIFSMRSNEFELVGNGESPTWSPDSKKLAYWDRGLIILDLENKNPIPYDEDSFHVISKQLGSYSFGRDLGWAPISNQLIYVTMNRRLVIVNLEERTIRWIEGIKPYVAGWFPNEKRIAFVGHFENEDTIEDQPSLCIYDLQTDVARRIMYVMR